MTSKGPPHSERHFELVEVPPLPPGRSPFHVRGVLYDRIMKSAASSSGGMTAFLGQIKDERIRTFAAQEFRWSDWYDALPMVPLQAALSRLQGGDFEQLVRRRARAAGEALVPKVFQIILKLGSPKAAAEHVPRLLTYYYDFVDVTIEADDNEGKGTFRGVPRLIAPGFVNTALGLVEGGLHLMGARLVNGTYSDVTKGRPRQGFDTIDCKVSFRWVK